MFEISISATAVVEEGSKLKICFVVDHPTPTRMGGAEGQCFLVANGLAAKGWDIAYVTTLNAPVTETGLKVYQGSRRWLRGNSWLARYSRALSLLRILRDLDPDALLVTYAGSLAGLVACYSWFFRKKFIYRAASSRDADLTFGKEGWSELGPVSRHLYLFAVRNARLIIANAESVAAMFRNAVHGKSVVVIRNGVEIDRSEDSRYSRIAPSYVLWMARLNELKNPSAFVALARRLPDVQFVMCGFGKLYKQITGSASGVPNLSLRGPVSGSAKDQALENAYAVINTSWVEGFPNTLLEAGIHRKPYISFFDPDEVICRYKLGFHVKSFSELVQKTMILVEDRKLREKLGSNIRSYVEREHDIENIVSEYDLILRKLLR